jgi:hypothetical protein
MTAASSLIRTGTTGKGRLMQTAGPYRLQQQLSRCLVGDVWSSVDVEGRPVTVAVLNEQASADQRWRGAFASAADALANAGTDQLPIVGCDHAAERPWVACADERGAGAAQLFTVLGQQVEPVGGPPPEATAALQIAADPGQESPSSPVPAEPAQPISAQPVPAQPISAQPASAQPVPAQPVPVQPFSVQPSSVQPFSVQPVSAQAAQHGPAQHGLAQQVPAQQWDTSQRWDTSPAATAVPPMDATAAQMASWPPAEINPVSGPNHPAGPYAPGYAPASGGPAASVTPQPTSSQPVSGGFTPADSYGPFGSSDTSAQPFGDTFGGLAADPYDHRRSRVFGDTPPAKPRRTKLLVALVATVGLLVGGGAGAGITYALGDHKPAPSPAPTQATPPTAAQLLLPAAAPAAPGVEPPQGGGWPASWPAFTSTEATKPMNGLAGAGFDFRAPPAWNCAKQEQAAAAVHYACGTGQGAGLIGGDLWVRDCVAPCDDAERTELRRKEEAWGLHWTKSGPFVTWAQTTSIDGKQEYGLVYVAFWRSAPEHQLDRELVLRVRAPLANSDDVKKVAMSIRDSTFTL